MKDKINSMHWNDFLLESIGIDYDKIVIIASFDEKKIEISCNNFISIQYLGQWDESVISTIKVFEDDGFCKESRLIVDKNNTRDLLGGGTKSINSKWYHVQIELLDGVNIHIVCTNISLNL